MTGALSNLIELLGESHAPDGAGGSTRSFAPGRTLWAEVRRLPSARDGTGDRARRLQRLAVVIRRGEDAQLNGRLRFQGVDFEIVSIESEEERKSRLTLICEEALP